MLMSCARVGQPASAPLGMQMVRPHDASICESWSMRKPGRKVSQEVSAVNAIEGARST